MKDIPNFVDNYYRYSIFYLLRMLGCDFSGNGSYEPRDWFRGI